MINLNGIEYDLVDFDVLQNGKKWLSINPEIWGDDKEILELAEGAKKAMASKNMSADGYSMARYNGQLQILPTEILLAINSAVTKEFTPLGQKIRALKDDFDRLSYEINYKKNIFASADKLEAISAEIKALENGDFEIVKELKEVTVVIKAEKDDAKNEEYRPALYGKKNIEVEVIKILGKKEF